MVSLDITLIYLIVLFCALMLFLENVAFKPTIRLIEERRKRIEGRFERAEGLRREKEELEERYRSSIEKARDEAIAIKNSLIAEGKNLYDREVSEERKRLGEAVPKEREKILQKLEAELSQLRKEMEASGLKIAETLLGRKIE